MGMIMKCQKYTTNIYLRIHQTIKMIVLSIKETRKRRQLRITMQNHAMVVLITMKQAKTEFILINIILILGEINTIKNMLQQKLKMYYQIMMKIMMNLNMLRVYVLVLVIGWNQMIFSFKTHVETSFFLY